MNSIARNLLSVNNLAIRTGSRTVHGNADILDNVGSVKNRNPRNLEIMRIARKPHGYHLDRQVRAYWHTLKLTRTPRHVTAEVCHFERGPVITVSSKEWALKKQLYRLTDTAAYINVGRVLARRCLESGISFVGCYLEATEGGKLEMFLKEVEKGGIKLEEPSVYKKPHPWDQFRPEKPWDPTVE